jgi:shikimate kinase
LTARLALIGAPGAGKTTVGRQVAQVWDCPFLDTDDEYAATYGHTVAEAVIDDESVFRDREQDVVTQALRESGAVVAVGSGAVASAAVRSALGPVLTVWLEVGLVDAAKRTGLSGARPAALGNVRGQLADMLAQRGPLYAATADLRVGTEGRTPQDIVREITQWEAAR